MVKLSLVKKLLDNSKIVLSISIHKDAGLVFVMSDTYYNPYKPGILFVGHGQTVQNQIRHLRVWHQV